MWPAEALNEKSHFDWSRFRLVCEISVTNQGGGCFLLGFFWSFFHPDRGSQYTVGPGPGCGPQALVTLPFALVRSPQTYSCVGSD